MSNVQRKKQRIGLPEWLDMGNLAIGILVGIIGTVIGIRAIASQETIAEKSGAFEKPAFQVALAGMETSGNTFDLAVGSTFEPSTLTIFALPLTVMSVGERSVEDVYIQFRYHQMHNLLLDEQFVSLQTNFDSGPRKISHMDPFEYAMYHFEKIHPGVRLNIGEPIVLRETRIVDEIDATTKDKKTLHVKYAVDYALQLGISVAAKDLNAHDYLVSVRGIKASSMDGLIKNVVSSIEKSCQKPAPPSLLDRLLGRSNTIDTDTMILMYPHRKLAAQVEGHPIIEAQVQSKDDIALLSYPTSEGNFAVLQTTTGKPQLVSLNCKSNSHDGSIAVH